MTASRINRSRLRLVALPLELIDEECYCDSLHVPHRHRLGDHRPGDPQVRKLEELIEYRRQEIRRGH